MKAGPFPRPRIGATAVVAAAFVVCAGSAALAQNPRASPPTAAKPHPTVRPPAKKPTPAPQPASSSPAAAGPPLAAIVASDAGVVETRTLDGGTRIFKFSELDIEGRLKSPQLVYFLRRVRAEFAAGDLGHRSFLREMSETRKEPTF